MNQDRGYRQYSLRSFYHVDDGTLLDSTVDTSFAFRYSPNES
ncbi:hypothetical protein [Luteolibacter pohnpeiensis]|nr:hypothetical protein [Luteolibacter pohnpeiensis]